MKYVNLGRIDEWREDLEWYHVVGSLLLGLLVFLAIGFIAGGYSPPGSPPSLDFSESNAEIVTDSLRRLESKDLEVVTTVFRVDLGTGERLPAPEEWERAQLSHSTGRYRVGSHESVNGSWEIYLNSHSMWYRVFGKEWQEQDVRFGREFDRDWVGGILEGCESSTVGVHLENTRWEVISNTSSTITLRSSDSGALRLFTTGRIENASVRIAISKTPTRDLQRVEVTLYYPDYRIETIRAVSGIGNTSVNRPASLPPVTVQELKNRIGTGWKRLLPI